MKITDILKYEANNKNGIFLFREGCFFRAYNRSAMCFVNQIKSIKIIKKYIKYIDEKIFYCGFPKSYLKEVLECVKNKGLKIEQLDENFHIWGEELEKGNYINWKNKIKSEEKNNDKSTLQDFILKKIKNYPIDDKTPKETVEFSYEVKELVEML